MKPGCLPDVRAFFVETIMTFTLPIGVLYSTTGTYQRISKNARSGALQAVADINADATSAVTLVVHEYDPHGELEAYHQGVEALFARGVRHVVGTTTSASRKDIVPDVERDNALLWYACPYEGFECSENVLYSGGCPSQNLVPLLAYALREYGKRGVLIGSNYVWGWESNRIARELVEATHGRIVAEKYFHFGDCDFDAIVTRILKDATDFVLNNLVGESSYAFLAQLDAACERHGTTITVLSCNFTECELPAIPRLRHVRLLSCGPWFDHPGNGFSARQRVRHGPQIYSSCYTNAYNAVQLLARSCAAVGSDDPAAVLAWLHANSHSTLMGELAFNPSNNHLALPCCIAEARGDGFRIVHRESGVLDADPYLTRTGIPQFRDVVGAALTSPRLRVVK